MSGSELKELDGSLQGFVTELVTLNEFTGKAVSSLLHCQCLCAGGFVLTRLQSSRTSA